MSYDVEQTQLPEKQKLKGHQIIDELRLRELGIAGFASD